MSYKTILVHVEANAASDARLAAAVDLARRFDATLVGVGAAAFNPPVESNLYFVDGELVQTVHDQIEAGLKKAEAAFHSVTCILPRESIWRSAVDFPNLAMDAYACCADLIVASQPPRKGADLSRFARPGDLIMETGMPVLVVPPETTSIAARKVMIAWKNTPQARRAAWDALPLLKQADEVLVVQVSERGGTVVDNDCLEDVTQRLRRHGVRVQGEVLPQLDSVSEDIVNIARSNKADLIVAGAYGHTRVREWAFGGATQDLLRGSPVPVLFSH